MQNRFFSKVKDNSIYALYKGNRNLMDGTLEEISKATGKSIRNLKRYTWKSHNDSLEEKDLLLDRDITNRISLVLLENDKEIKKKYQYNTSIPEDIYKIIESYSKEMKITRNQIIIQCIEYALEHKEENFLKKSHKKS